MQEIEEILNMKTRIAREIALENLIKDKQREAVEGFISNAKFIKHIPAGNTYVYQNGSDEDVYVIGVQNLESEK